MNVRLQNFFIPAVFLALLLPTTSGAQERIVIRQTEQGFDAPTVIIEAGDTVEFINDRQDPVWIASDLHPSHTAYPGSDVSACGGDVLMFDACGATAPGESFTFTFTEGGAWGYHDHLHPTFGGQIIVRGGEERVWRSSLSGWQRFKAVFFRQWFEFAPAFADSSVRGYPVRDAMKDPIMREYLIRMYGHNRVLAALERPRGDERTPVICHLEGHYVGRMAYELGYVALGDVALDTRCQLGFYHGLLETGIGSVGTDETIAKLAADCETRKGEPIFVVSCYHGLGHGLIVYHRYDLPTALEKCRIIQNEKAWDLCYHGAFMENAFVARGFGVEHETEWLKEDDPWFPCNDEHVATRDGAIVCAFSLPAIWSAPMFNPDEQIARCAEFDDARRSFCFQGFGFNTTAWYIFDERTMMQTCERAERPDDVIDCVSGAVVMASLIRTQSTDFVNARLCQVHPDGPEACGKAVAERLSWVFNL